MLLAAIVLAAASQTGTSLPPKEAALLDKLRARVEAVDRALDGVLGFAVKDLKTGATFELRGNEVFPQASSIKVAVLYELYRQADEGKIDLAELTRPPLPRVGGGGVLQLLGPDARFTWRDLAILMMGWSDNEATNRLIDKVGMDAVNRRLDTLGLRATRLRRRMMDLEAARRGDENVSTPVEMRALMEVVHSGTGLAPARAKDLLAVASVPKDSPFREPLPETLVVADKPGSLEAVRCVSAAVELPGRPYVVTIMTTFLRRDADGAAAIREISSALFETFDRLARGSEYGRVIPH
ncbi:MAG TPA: serine hydrolase [Vicinamibacteria bacterium]|jgi:beta-lactamase class A|nr:serine hydrolase [Vicinamibacteria bacterium]